jgi:NAD-dependent deacetylase
MRKLCNDVQPTLSHKIISNLSKKFNISVVTTNVDSLHKRAGTDAIEIHGTLRKLKCMCCGNIKELDFNNESLYPGCKLCGNWLRHHVTLWDEEIQNFQKYQSLISEADCIILIGLSGIVTNTKKIAKEARKSNKKVFEINPSFFTPATFYTTKSYE